MIISVWIMREQMILNHDYDILLAKFAVNNDYEIMCIYWLALCLFNLPKEG